MKKILMHKNKKVAIIECNEFYINNIEIINGYLMPIELSDNIKKINEDFMEWKKERCKPCSPQNFTNPMLSMIGSTYEDISNYICASVNDCYWFKPYDIENILWEDINYFDNGILEDDKKINMYNNSIYKYDNYNDVLDEMINKYKISKNFMKYYTLNENNKFCIVKSCDFMNCGIDVFNELIGNILCEVLELDCAEYYILPYNITYKNKQYNIPLVCCELFTQDDQYEVISAKNLIKCGEINEHQLFEYIISMGFGEQLNKMIILDYLMLNPDRNFTNISFIRNSETLEITKLAPVYDCGASFNNSKRDYVTKNSAEDEAMPFLEKHSQQINLVDNFDFVNFNELYDALDIIEAVISYSALSNEQQTFIINTLKTRINLLKEVAEKSKNSLESSIVKLKIAEKIKRRFDVKEMIDKTGIDPLVVQNKNNLFINYLSEQGKKEFYEFEKENPNLKQRFENFKLDTFLC